MSATRVVNVRDEPCEVYIGRALYRASAAVRRNLPAGDGWPLVVCTWGNPFAVEDWDRGGAIELFRELMMVRLGRNGALLASAVVREHHLKQHEPHPQFWIDRLADLRGKRLGCWCAPKPCHGDVLVELVNALPMLAGSVSHAPGRCSAVASSAGPASSGKSPAAPEPPPGS